MIDSWKKILWFSINVSTNGDVFLPRTVACLNESGEQEIHQYLEDEGYCLYQADVRDWQDGCFEKLFRHEKMVNDIEIDQIKTFLFHDFETDANTILKLKNLISYALEQKKFIINYPQTILHNLDKKYLLELKQCGVPIIDTYLTYEEKQRFLSEHKGSVLVKPRTADKGNGVEIINGEITDKYLEENYIMQPFMDDFEEGEFSAVFLLNKYRFSFIRRRTPQSGIFNNVSKGGEILNYIPEKSELNFCEYVLESYRGLGYQVIYGRVDYIKTKKGLLLTEAEFANPILPMGLCQDFSTAFAKTIQSLCQEEAKKSIRVRA